jgi:Sec-independent protein secretion pathway component TatC
VLIIFIAAAVLTTSTDWWNQTIVAAPMMAMYLLSIVVAWLVAPRDSGESDHSRHLRLVVSASLLEQARRRRATKS